MNTITRSAFALPATVASAALILLAAGPLFRVVSTPQIPSPQVERSAAEIGAERSWSGALLVRGVEVSPPFDIALGEDSLLVNGIRLSRSAPATEADVEAGGAGALDERAELWAAFHASWSAWCGVMTTDAARAAALAFFAESPLVADVTPSDELLSDLEIRFMGDDTATHVHLHRVDAASEPDGDGLRAWRQGERLRLAARLRAHLARGGLAVIQDEGHCIWPPVDEGAAIVAELREIVRGAADDVERVAAVRELIPDDEAARDIAARFESHE